MSRLRCARLLSLTIAAALPLGALAPSCSTGTSTVGQRITCADHGAGAVNCRPMTAAEPPGTGSDSCEDVDEDGDGTPHDEGDHDGSSAPRIVRSHDGSGSDADDDDDDHDGIPNERDCDHRHGGDDDQGDDDQGEDHDGDHDGSDGSGHDGSDGSGHDGSGHDGSGDDGSGGSGTH